MLKTRLSTQAGEECTQCSYLELSSHTEVYGCWWYCQSNVNVLVDGTTFLLYGLKLYMYDKYNTYNKAVHMISGEYRQPGAWSSGGTMLSFKEPVSALRLSGLLWSQLLWVLTAELICLYLSVHIFVWQTYTNLFQSPCSDPKKSTHLICHLFIVPY